MTNVPISGKTEPGPLSDYAGFRTSEGPYVRYQPTGLAELCDLVRDCCQREQPIRVRANGHSLNGQSLPRAGEILVDLRHCRHYRFTRAGSVTVGAGAAVWDVVTMLRSHGFELLVFNDGGQAASSVGGYMAAGGFGESSRIHGGFWESVERITLVVPDGRRLDLRPGDDIFPWMFGSMGQLGIAWEFRLRINPLSGSPTYPDGLWGRIEPSRPQWHRILWFTLFAPRERAAIARREMIRIGVRHRHSWIGLWPYAYDIRFHRFNPPLIHPVQASLGAVGIWGSEPPGGFDEEAVHAIERDVAELAAENPEYRRYLQAEIASQPIQSYFEPEIWSAFAAIKSRLDPAGLINPGVVARRAVRQGKPSRGTGPARK